MKLLIVTVLLFSQTVIAMGSPNIDKAITDIRNNLYTGIDSVLVYQKNKLISENYFNGYSRSKHHDIRSSFKSITGILAAIAFDKGILSPEELVVPLLSRFHKLEFIDPLKANLKVKDLLHMVSGLDCAEMPGSKGTNHEFGIDEGPTPLKYGLSITMTMEPGKEWHYCNANTFLLGVTISAGLDRAGTSGIDQFAKENLYSPLNITEYRTFTTPDGFLYAAGSARFSPHDLAKFGLVILNKGMYKNKRVVSQKHINEILDGVVETHWTWTDNIHGHAALTERYGYQWHRTVFEVEEKKIPVSHSWGNGGQFIFVVPSQDKVIVFTGSNYNDIYKQKKTFEIMHKYLLSDD
ncbi:MAG: CubicO group peptidase (beta-lactamase class C family) [Alteromonadaceae bacterium]|jgi:CubicO group peptidase (beta-lactamase class C family)